MEKKMSGQKMPKKSSIEKFHQERSDQDVTGRVIKGRKIVVKAKTSPFVTVLSSGQRLVLTNNLYNSWNLKGTLKKKDKVQRIVTEKSRFWPVFKSFRSVFIYARISFYFFFSRTVIDSLNLIFAWWSGSKTWSSKFMTSMSDDSLPSYVII